VARALNYALYQIGWFACILGAAWHAPWAGTALGAVTLTVHLALARRRADELALVIVVGIIGTLVESIQIGLGTLVYDRGVIIPALPPAWMLLLWMQFAATLNFSLSWLLDRRKAMAFGAIGGPLAFVAASSLGVVSLDPRLWPSILSLAILWGIGVPLAATAASRQQGRPGAGRYVFE